MDTVSVGGFHDNIIGFINELRVTDERLVDISDISRKYQLSGNSVLGQCEDNACRAEKMACITEINGDTIAYLHSSFIFMRNEQLDSTESVIHCIKRFIWFFTTALSLSASPFCFKFLNMCAVTKHDTAKI